MPRPDTCSYIFEIALNGHRLPCFLPEFNSRSSITDSGGNKKVSYKGLRRILTIIHEHEHRMENVASYETTPFI